MPALTPQLDAPTVERIIRGAVPMANSAGIAVDAIGPGVANVRLAYRDWMLRPGGSIAGPVVMLAADTAMYAVILAHIGEQLMAVTSDMTMHFLARPLPGDVLAEGRLLKLGRRLAVCEVAVRSAADPETLVAHVTGSYALPSSR